MSVTGCSLMRKDQSEMLASTKQEGGAGGEGEGGDGEDGARPGGLCCQNKELMLNEVENNHVCWGPVFLWKWKPGNNCVFRVNNGRDSRLFKVCVIRSKGQGNLKNTKMYIRHLTKYHECVLGELNYEDNSVDLYQVHKDATIQNRLGYESLTELNNEKKRVKKQKKMLSKRVKSESALNLNDMFEKVVDEVEVMNVVKMSKTLNCSECATTFMANEALKSHIKRRHKIAKPDVVALKPSASEGEQGDSILGTSTSTVLSTVTSTSEGPSISFECLQLLKDVLVGIDIDKSDDDDDDDDADYIPEYPEEDEVLEYDSEVEREEVNEEEDNDEVVVEVGDDAFTQEELIIIKEEEALKDGAICAEIVEWIEEQRLEKIANEEAAAEAQRNVNNEDPSLEGSVNQEVAKDDIVSPAPEEKDEINEISHGNVGGTVAERKDKDEVVREAPRKRKTMAIPCKECGLEFDRKGRLQNHMNAVHLKVKSSLILCNTCGQGFRDRANFEEHERTPTACVAKWRCEPCKKVFSSKQKLDVHLKSSRHEKVGNMQGEVKKKSENGEGVPQTSQLEKKEVIVSKDEFLDEVALNVKGPARHIETIANGLQLGSMSKEKENEKMNVRKRDQTRALVDVNVEVYDDDDAGAVDSSDEEGDKEENPVKTSVVDLGEAKEGMVNDTQASSGTKDSNVRIEVNKRAGMGKQHCCTQCKTKFSSFVELKRHKKLTHMLTFKCEVCENVYETKQKMKRHKEWSHDKGTFLCDLCDFKFSNSRLLRKHKESCHG